MPFDRLRRPSPNLYVRVRFGSRDKLREDPLGPSRSRWAGRIVKFARSTAEWLARSAAEDDGHNGKAKQQLPPDGTIPGQDSKFYQPCFNEVALH